MSLTTVLLRDEFSDDRAAGAVNGTLATDGVNTRTVVDTNSKLSVGSGVASFSTGGAAIGNPGIWYPPLTRIAGLMMLAKASHTSSGLVVGFDTNQSGGVYDAIVLSGTSLQVVFAATTLTVGAISTATNYSCYVVQRATGASFFVQGGLFTYPTLVWLSATGSANLFPANICLGTTSVGSSDYIRAAGYWLPTPLVSHGFDSVVSPSDGNGHAETSGLGSGGSGVVMSGTTWSVSGGKGINTPATGSELLTNGGMEGAYSVGVAPNWTTIGLVTPSETADAYTGSKAQQITNTDGSTGNGVYQNVAMTTGEWLLFTGYTKRISGAGGCLLIGNSSVVNQTVTPASSSASYTKVAVSARCIASGNARAQILSFGSAVIANFDNLSAKKMALKDLISLHTSTTPDVFEGIDITVVSGTQAGLALNWDNATTPTNGVIAYNDGTNAKLEKCVAGTWTTVVSAASTYSANARLVVSKIGTAYRLYYNNALVGSGTISDAGIVNNTLHGRFSTYEGNTLDNYTCYASGTGGEYDSVFDICVSAVSAMSGIGTMSADATITRNATLALAGSTVMSADLSVDSSLRLAAELALTGSTAMSATFVKNIELALTGSAVMSATVQTLKRAELALSGTSTMHIHNFTKNSSIRSPGYTATIYS